MKKGWAGSSKSDKNDSCLNDPYGDDMPSGKKKSKRQLRDDRIEEVVERGGSSQDKFESDFIDDESIPNYQNLSS